MVPVIQGIHHITAICGDPQRNVDFYGGLLGLRLVKKTVNFDSPTTYHLYYGNERGDPGTILTFFPWPGLPRGRRGTGQVTTVSFSVPATSLDWWARRLAGRDVPFDGPSSRFGERTIRLADPDGLGLELVGHRGADPRPAWSGGSVPAEHAVRGLHRASLSLESHERTARLLTDGMGFELGDTEDPTRFRYGVADGRPGQRLELVCEPGVPPGHVAVGTVHHIAFRTSDETTQRHWRSRLTDLGLNVTPVLDRNYFRSIYFREPGGVLFEIATDPPGFTVDESVDALGARLQLPSWLESRREELERTLPPLRRPMPRRETAG